MRKNEKTKNFGYSRPSPKADFLINLLKSLAAGAVAALLVSVLFCACAISKSDPAKYIDAAAYVSLTVGAFVCGFLSSKLNSNAGIIPCLAVGATLAALQLGCHLILGDGEKSFFSELLSACAVLILSLLGGIVGKFKIVRKRRRRKYK